MAAALMVLMVLILHFHPDTPPPVTYYVNSFSPAASDDHPGTQAQPWRTLARVQAALPDLRPGDRVLFARGGVYPGALDATGLHGAADAPITFGAYGLGDKPILSGMVRLDAWTAIGDDRYVTVCHACVGMINGLALEGTLQPLARFPNRDEADEGYLYFDDAPDDSTLIDDALSGADWTGGELVVRSIAWVLDRLPIIAHTDDTLSAGVAASYRLTPGYGYFIQNHPDALDRDGEWTYDRHTRQITLLSRAGNPSARGVQVTAIERLLTLEGAHHITLSDLVLEGANALAVHAGACSAIHLERIDIVRGGADGLFVESCHRLSMTDSSVIDMLNNGIDIRNCAECRLHDNHIARIGLLAGMGRNGDGMYNGIQFGGQNAELTHNRIEYIGYNGIVFSGAVLIRHNVVRHFAQTKVDGGGIYCWRNRDSQVIGNVVLHGMGSTAGIPWETPGSHGIYIDDQSEKITVRDNVIGYVGASGIMLHNTRDVRVIDNLIFAAEFDGGILLADDELGDYNVEETVVTGNAVLALPSPDAHAVTIMSDKGADFPLGIGIMQSNILCHPIGHPPIAFVDWRDGDWTRHGFTLSAWRDRYGLEQNSSGCPDDRAYPDGLTLAEIARIVINDSADPALFTLESDALELRGSAYRAGETISLPPFSALVLLMPADDAAAPPG
jgi:hypothetical protein